MEAFTTRRPELERALGARIDRIDVGSLDAAERALANASAELAIVMTRWGQDPDTVAATFERIRGRHPERSMVFLDYYAPATSPYFDILPLVDRYVKRQVLRDRSLYLASLEGGTPLTDFLATRMGYDLEGWWFGSRPDPSRLGKLSVGWSLGVTERNRRLLALSRVAPRWKYRPLAVHRRIGVTGGPRREWYERYRRMGLERLEPVTRACRCTGAERVSRKRYLGEMFLSKLTFSPFGWGELCFRDYEAVCCGSLLVKPSMDHLETHPDIFVAGRTYAPTRWDLSDLADVCAYYLSHPEEAEAIVSEARRVMTAYFQGNGLADDLLRCLPLDEIRSH